MTNNTPPNACLADFDHITTIADADQSVLQGAIDFMPPEHFDPQGFGLESWVPAQKADIYGFGLTVFQVLVQYSGY